MADAQLVRTRAHATGDDIRAQLITTEQALVALRPEWDALWHRCPWATPFQSPAWQLAWWRHLGGGEVRVITLRRGVRLVGIAPLFLYGPAASRHLALIGSGISDYNDILLDPERAERGADVIMGQIAEWRAEWIDGSLTELRSASPLLQARVPHSLHVHMAPSSVCPVLPLAGSFEIVEQAMGHTHRRKLRQCQHRLERAGGARLEVATEATVHALLDALVHLHERRWRELGEEGVLADPRVRAFHHDVAPQLLANGCLRLFALHLRGTIIAVLYAMAWRGRFYCYLSGLDPDAHYYSPGVAIVRAAIEYAIANGLHEVDFLRGAEPYKYLWGATDRPNQVLHLQPLELPATRETR
jgi:CelD/BcsL family acetyltransferase involved in cellulose biosynthesis